MMQQQLVFESVLGSIAPALSTDRVCQVGTMSEGNITIPVQVSLNLAIASLSNDLTLPGHGIPLQWLYSF